jgi:hypothetical protein
MEPITSHQVPGHGDFYFQPKSTGRDMVIEPHSALVQGKPVLLTSVVVPILGPRVAGNGLLYIINDILDFSKIEAGKLRMDAKEFLLEDVYQHVIDLVGMRATEKNLEFLLDTAPDVPQALVGDPLRLGQVLTNLCSNAVKFTVSGEIIVVTFRKLQEEQDRVTLQFCVRDPGIGMTEEQVRLLFQPFSQVDSSSTRKFAGTGLGLAISKRLVEMMGGEIWVVRLQRDVRARACPVRTAPLGPGGLARPGGGRQSQCPGDRAGARPGAGPYGRRRGLRRGGGRGAEALALRSRAPGGGQRVQPGGGHGIPFDAGPGDCARGGRGAGPGATAGDELRPGTDGSADAGHGWL